jgi:flagellar biosynthesis chaperone FliJ
MKEQEEREQLKSDIIDLFYKSDIQNIQIFIDVLNEIIKEMKQL